ncbi:MAG: choice-of-anchor tandem repeat GloVer-containing protein [Candidatus Cybelea sp.]
MSPRFLGASFIAAVLVACNEMSTGIAPAPPPTRAESAASRQQASVGTIEVLWTFTNGSDGADPRGGVIADAGGNLYGGASAGAHDDFDGTVFELTPSATGYHERTLVRFKGPDGDSPSGGLVMDAAGQLFGTTVWGGRYKYGTAFYVTTQGRVQQRVLWSFGGNSFDGAVPDSGLAIDAHGALYGVTEYGGALGYGTVFKLTPAGREYRKSTIWKFGTRFDGKYPDGPLTLGPHGVIYGTAGGGGNGCSNGCGIVFELIPAKSRFSQKILWNFKGGPSDGSSPGSSLSFDSAGDIYGTTYFGGDTSCADGYGCGTIFKLTPSSAAYTEKVVWNFGKGSDGDYPLSSVLIGPHGKLFGTTQQGGSHLGGILYELTRKRRGYSERILWNFARGPYGYDPEGNLIMDGERRIYGTAYAGGSTGDGTVFRFTL